MKPFQVGDCTRAITGGLNRAFGNKEPWQVAAITATTVLGTMWLWTFINQDESEQTLYNTFMYFSASFKSVINFFRFSLKKMFTIGNNVDPIKTHKLKHNQALIDMHMQSDF